MGMFCISTFSILCVQESCRFPVCWGKCKLVLSLHTSLTTVKLGWHSCKWFELTGFLKVHLMILCFVGYWVFMRFYLRQIPSLKLVTLHHALMVINGNIFSSFFLLIKRYFHHARVGWLNDGWACRCVWPSPDRIMCWDHASYQLLAEL